MAEGLSFILFLIAVALMSLGVRRLLKYHSLNNWERINASINSISENSKEEFISEFAKLKYFFPEITYEYFYKNKKYESNVVSNNIENVWVPEVTALGEKTPDSEKFWLQWKIGDEIKIYVNPKNPSESVIYRQLNKNFKSHNMALMLSGLILLVIWFYLK